VVNMDGADLPRPQGAGGEKQRGGIGATAVGDGQRP
jgi:hypothetical protein